MNIKQNKIKINNMLSIPESELSFTASRSSGPGGQHVNKVSSRITLSFNVLLSASLSEEERLQILNKLKTRTNREGILQISSQAQRSQFANKEAVLKRFVELLRHALYKKPQRKKTQVPRGVKLRRLEHKRKQSNLKKMRSKNDD